MGLSIRVFCLLLAVVFFLLAGFNVPSDGKVSFTNLGYAAVAAAFLFG